MKKLLIGTGNPAKLQMYKDALKEFNFELVTAADLNIPEPEETGSTFEKTAIDKVKYYFEKSGIPAISDDGGFEIEALNGEPGVKSNRWIGRQMTDEEIIAEVFKRMQGIANRNCKHTIVIAVASSLGIYTAHSEVSGVVAEKPTDKRAARLPYRSVMFLPNYNKYWIELTDQEETIMNHRAHAIEKLKDILQELSK